MTLSEVLPGWTVIPFFGLLLSIALLPQIAPRFWHHPRNQLLVALAWAAPVSLLLLGHATGDGPAAASAAHALEHAGREYASFLALVGSLYVISGGIRLHGDLEGRPSVNTAFLAFGTVLANVVGTTGAAMLLVRPLLATNSERKRTMHIPVFFIFLVCNVGGSLTPIGDPPLFLGYLRGVPFFWTVEHLFAPWLFASGALLAVFYVFDRIEHSREDAANLVRDRVEVAPLRLDGALNFVLIFGVIACVLLPQLRHGFLRELGMVGLAGVSLAATPRRIRTANDFAWAPILEVGALFAGIFLAMIPATALLEAHGAALGVSEPWQYFWASGLLSAFLDNAPTYVTFTAIACGSVPTICPSAEDLGALAAHADTIPLLRAISLGSVFLGAGSYIGNGPNFMVRAIAVQAGYAMPSFFGYCGWAAVFLVPVSIVTTLVFL